MHNKLEIRFDSGWLAAKGLPRERSGALLRLLADLERSSSLREAARSVGVSYRFAWGALGEAQRVFGAPLVEMQRGRGARLTPLGRRVVEVDRKVRRELAEHFERLRAEIPALLGAAEPLPRHPLVLHASHDLALEALAERCAMDVQLDVVFRGSDDGLAALARGECQLAGFHVADALPRAAAAAAALGKWLDPRKHVLLHFVTREQGLIVRPGSRIRGVHDLARPGVRFIHRQTPGTGAESVAELVSAGRADAGFGLRADASRLKLSFVPLAKERYFLACAKVSLKTPPMLALAAALASRAFAAEVAKLPGYDASDAGRRETIDAATAWVGAKRP
jgi:molybdate transport repressor ModE-like protein